ncbi:Vacuolar protein sorting-associated protein 62 [Ascosphaera aggregata]|nr:Vacuolar protein sorting-associated protein 62 [Ascosphaera aggregata]
MRSRTRVTIYILSFCIVYVCLNSLAHAVNPEWFIWFDEDLEEAKWLASSPSWWDRKACRWLSLCGLAHFKKARALYGYKVDRVSWRSEGGNDNGYENENEIGNGNGGVGHDDYDDFRGNYTPDDLMRHLSSDSIANDQRIRNLARNKIPSYVFEYAPLVHLHSEEQYWPSDIGEHLLHTVPYLNYTAVPLEYRNASLDSLDILNQWEKGRFVFLTSDSNVEERPDWIEARHNIPQPGNPPVDEEWFPGVYANACNDAVDDIDDPSRREDTEKDADNELNDAEHHKTTTTEKSLSHSSQKLQSRSQQQLRPPNLTPGRSSAPVVLIVVDKGDGIVDAFWFYFYSFNLGNVVLGIRFGNHVGDWEHSLVRFHHGKPKSIFFSAHSAGEAYSYDAVEKIGKRPVIYSASGTHAMYASPGIHTYGLPWGLLHDVTERGSLWDPTLNAYTYTYNVSTDELLASTYTPKAPLSWFYFSGHWGDKFYALNDNRQYRFGGQYHYVNGPLGPRFKHLDRTRVCPGDESRTSCVIRDWIGTTSGPSSESDQERTFDSGLSRRQNDPSSTSKRWSSSSGSSNFEYPPRLKRWVGIGTGEEHSDADLARFLN